MALNRAALRRRYNSELPRYDRARENLVRVVKSVLEDLAPTRGIRPVPLVESSVKDFDSFYAKACDFERKRRVGSTGDCFEKIRDLARARIICQTVKDADLISRLLSEQNEVFFRGAEVETHAPELGRESTGYRAIHLDLEIDAQVGQRKLATPCELQVLTALQYAWGLYTHKDFYKGEGVPPLVGTMMRELSDLLYVADRFAGHLIEEAERESAAPSSAGRGARRQRTSAPRSARARGAARAA
jgi:ppGpp synthetase/RelA/SpoT-type nucleotidyltranferase